MRLLLWLVTSFSPFSMCLSKPRISKWDFPDTTVPNSISDCEIWYFLNSNDPRTPHKMHIYLKFHENQACVVLFCYLFHTHKIFL